MKTQISTDIGRAAHSAAANLSKENLGIARSIINALKAEKSSKLSAGTKRSLRVALKNTTNPSQRALLINAVGAAFAQGAIGVGSGAAEVASSIVAPIMASKTEQARIAAEVAKESIAAGRSISERAIEAGVWNSGITGLPVNNAETAPGQIGTSSDSGTTGSFLGG